MDIRAVELVLRKLIEAMERRCAGFPIRYELELLTIETAKEQLDKIQAELEAPANMQTHLSQSLENEMSKVNFDTCTGLACGSECDGTSHAIRGNNINGTTELTEEDWEDAEEIYWQWENGYELIAVEKVHAIRVNPTIELDCGGFDEWWNDTVKDGQWTSLERLAARDAWHAALNRAARSKTRSGVTTDVGE